MMTKQELFLKTIFCCMACDGDIAPEEVLMVKELSGKTDLFQGLDVEERVNFYIAETNRMGVAFLNQYLTEIKKMDLTDAEQQTIVDFAIRTIEADSQMEYSEIKFFKKIRKRLSISDEQILERHPDKEDFLLPDIAMNEEPAWGNFTFETINISTNEEK